MSTDYTYVPRIFAFCCALVLGNFTDTFHSLATGTIVHNAHDFIWTIGVNNLDEYKNKSQNHIMILI